MAMHWGLIVSRSHSSRYVSWPSKIEGADEVCCLESLNATLTISTGAGSFVSGIILPA